MTPRPTVAKYLRDQLRNPLPVRECLKNHMGRIFIHRDMKKAYRCYAVGVPFGTETLYLRGEAGGERSVPWACLYDNYRAHPLRSIQADSDVEK